MDTLPREWRNYGLAPRFDMNSWRWANFSPYELRCRGTGRLVIVPEGLDKLQAVRVILGKPMPVNSAYRTQAHNMIVGGAPDSMHLRALAWDINTTKLDMEQLIAVARYVGFRGIGRYPSKDFVHIDLREIPAEWKE